MHRIKKAIGSTLIVAGTMIGAGMLAFPLQTLDIGFTQTILLLLGSWFFMVASSMIGLKISDHFPAGSSFYTMAQQTLGPWGRTIILLAVMGLPYTLIAAYTSGASSFLQQVWPEMQSIYLSLGFILVLGIICVFKTAIIDHANRWLFVGKISVFTAVSFLGFQAIQVDSLQPRLQAIPLKFWALIPMFISTFGFHGSLPGVVAYMGKEQKKAIRQVFLWGMTIPLIIYASWLIIIFGTVGHIPAKESTTLPILISCIGKATHSAWLPKALDIFSQLALLTSFLGVALGLLNVVEDMLKGKKYNNPLNRGLITFLPPLVVVVLAPQIFVEAIAFAAVALLILSTLFPAYIALQLDKKEKSLALWYKAFLYMWFALGSTFIVIELGNTLNLCIVRFCTDTTH